MRRFHFTLRPVRDLREDRQTAAMLVLADRIRAHGDARAAVEAAKARHRRAETSLRRPSWPASALVQADRDRDAARVAAEQAAIEASTAAFGVDAARDDLVEAQRAVEVLSRLEGRQRAAHQEQRRHEEEREIADGIEMRSARLANAAAAERRRGSKR